jgi:hypothetical protein
MRQVDPRKQVAARTGKRLEEVRIEKRQADPRKQVAARTGKRPEEVRIEKRLEAAGFGIRQVTTCSRNQRKALGRG